MHLCVSGFVIQQKSHDNRPFTEGYDIIHIKWPGCRLRFADRVISRVQNQLTCFEDSIGQAPVQPPAHFILAERFLWHFLKRFQSFRNNFDSSCTFVWPTCWHPYVTYCITPFPENQSSTCVVAVIFSPTRFIISHNRNFDIHFSFWIIIIKKPPKTTWFSSF